MTAASSDDIEIVQLPTLSPDARLSTPAASPAADAADGVALAQREGERSALANAEPSAAAQLSAVRAAHKRKWQAATTGAASRAKTREASEASADDDTVEVLRTAARAASTHVDGDGRPSPATVHLIRLRRASDCARSDARRGPAALALKRCSAAAACCGARC